jgi:hypothetical protein
MRVSGLVRKGGGLGADTLSGGEGRDRGQGAGLEWIGGDD